MAFHIVKPNEIFDKIKVYRDDEKFSIHVSSYNYKDNQKLLGEIQILNNHVSALLSENGEYCIRDVYRDPDISVNASIFDDAEINKIPYFDEIYKYILKNNLQGVIVEFGYFDTKVGVNGENIIIYEIRTDY